jgi:hypothetical protein
MCHVSHDLVLSAVDLFVTLQPTVAMCHQWFQAQYLMLLHLSFPHGANNEF